MIMETCPGVLKPFTNLQFDGVTGCGAGVLDRNESFDGQVSFQITCCWSLSVEDVGQGYYRSDYFQSNRRLTPQRNGGARGCRVWASTTGSKMRYSGRHGRGLVLLALHSFI